MKKITGFLICGNAVESNAGGDSPLGRGGLRSKRGGFGGDYVAPKQHITTTKTAFNQAQNYTRDNHPV